MLEKYRIDDIRDVTGKMDQVQVGNRTIQSDTLNILHIAVYNQHLQIV